MFAVEATCRGSLPGDVSFRDDLMPLVAYDGASSKAGEMTARSGVRPGEPQGSIPARADDWVATTRQVRVS